MSGNGRFPYTEVTRRSPAKIIASANGLHGSSFKPGRVQGTLALHIDAQRRAGAAYLFESS